ncbi:MAG: N-acetylmuramoyl-L-alanine amidase [Chrysiogenetes bacterium]|nr:N-acetylmuramoyl-L-alanine amidase [Chrysiogenetes bacterium]
MEGTPHKTLKAFAWALVAGLLVFSGWPMARALAEGGGRAEVQAVRYSRGPRYARIVVELSRQVEFQVRELPADPKAGRSPRIFVDLTPAVRGPNVPAQIEGSGKLITRLRVGQFKPETARMVVDLKERTSYRTITLHDPFRIVLDVEIEKSAAAPAAAGEADESGSEDDPIAGILGGLVPKPRAPKAAPKPQSKPLIVIDAGHGGKDPGAVSKRKNYEKDIVLPVARKLAHLLKREGHRVMLTRDQDVFLELSERTQKANEIIADAGLFVSVHVNASPNSKAHGIETYYWNVKVDQSKASTIARENFTNLESVFKQSSGDLAAILSDLKYKDKERQSAALAGHLQRNMISSVSGKWKGVRDIGVQHGPLYVLALTNMPAALVELGFITNATEEKRLFSAAYQQRLAEGLKTGIEAYLKETGR